MTQFVVPKNCCCYLIYKTLYQKVAALRDFEKNQGGGWPILSDGNPIQYWNEILF
ncbi:MAG: hypothetical protein JSC161_000604 [Candidatus Tokpelaia sp. JSC161]|nr:MAG: hypothetical protein JSC161_000604 [Candidatus Tokpelaia sp. JSC161]